MKEELLYRYLSGETTEAENAEILAWLDSDPEAHLHELNRIRYICQAADEALLAVARPKRRRAPLLRLVRYASGVAASLLLLGGVWYFASRTTADSISDRMAVVEVPDGQYIRLTLEDGTAVWLNAGTRLEYPVVFNRSKRQVKISGEAIFDVTHEADRPFVVKTFVSEIEVLGTRLSVHTDEERNLFSTTLMQGRVKVVNLNDPSQTMLMEPNDMVSLVDGRFCKSRVQNFAETSWTEGLIHLESMPFDELMERFERAFAVHIVLECDPLPVVDIISGEIRVSDGIDNALSVLQQIVDFTYEHDYTHNTIYIR